MTPEQLLEERYIVNTPWPPNNNYQTGDIVYPSQFTGWHPKDYPVIFRRLEWWEFRDGKDLPRYIRTKRDGYVRQVHLHLKYGIQATWGGYWLYENCLPATAEEYEQFINRPSGK